MMHDHPHVTHTLPNQMYNLSGVLVHMGPPFSLPHLSLSLSHTHMHTYTHMQMYDLYGVLVHVGHSVHAGHYYCFVKAPNGFWFKCDDTHVAQCAERVVLAQMAYILFYVRRQPRSHHVRPKLPGAPAASAQQPQPQPAVKAAGPAPQSQSAPQPAPPQQPTKQQLKAVAAQAAAKGGAVLKITSAVAMDVDEAAEPDSPTAAGQPEEEGKPEVLG